MFKDLDALLGWTRCATEVRPWIYMQSCARVLRDILPCMLHASDVVLHVRTRGVVSTTPPDAELDVQIYRLSTEYATDGATVCSGSEAHEGVKPRRCLIALLHAFYPPVILVP